MENQEQYEDMLPEDAIPIAGIRIISYYDLEGQMAYKTAIDENGSTPVTTIIGLLEMSKVHIMNKSIEIIKKMKDEE